MSSSGTPDNSSYQRQPAPGQQIDPQNPPIAHQDPDHAPSDGPNMVPLKDLEGLLRKLMELDSVAKH